MGDNTYTTDNRRRLDPWRPSIGIAPWDLE
jgi:hypothetical protein